MGRDNIPYSNKDGFSKIHSVSNDYILEKSVSYQKKDGLLWV